MLRLSDYLMYIKYYKKNLFLWGLKKLKKLDYTGRIENPDIRFRGYEGCYPVSRLLKRFDISENDTILDIGCGKGLFLYYALNFPFSKIDGIEYSEALVKIANVNKSILSNSRINIYCCDARKFLNYSEYNYFFINNPFSRAITKEVVELILKSYELRKRDITVLYQFAFNKDLFTSKGFKIVYDQFPNTILTFGK